MNPVIKLLIFLTLIFFAENYSQERINHKLLREKFFSKYLVENSKFYYNEILDFLNSYTQKSKLLDNSTCLFIDSIIVSSLDGAKIKTTVVYNSSSRAESYTIFSLQNNEWIKWYKMSNEYNSDGNVSITLHENWINNNWENDIYEIFRYDTLGNNLTHIIQAWVGNKWFNFIKNSYAYDMNGDLIKSLQEVWEDENWVKATRVTNQFYPPGIKTSNLIEDWENTNWVVKYLNTFEYDKLGKLVSILNKRWVVDRWQNYAKKIFINNQDEPQSIHLLKIWANNIWNDYDRYIYNYNNFNYLVDGFYEYFFNGQWVPGEGFLELKNPDGFEIHFIANEIQVYYNSITDVGNDVNPVQYALSQNFPHPFNPTTNIKFSIPQRGYVKLVIYNLLGEVITILVDEVLQAGNHIVPFNAENLNSGIYIYRIESAIFFQSNKMILLK